MERDGEGFTPDPTSIESLVAALERSVLDRLRWHVLVGAILIVVFGFIELKKGRGDFALSGLVVSLFVIAASAWGRRFGHRGRKLLFVGGFMLLSVSGIGHFGPLLGAGVFVVLAILLGTFFYGARGALITTTILATCIILVAVGAEKGWLKPTYALPALNDWVRIVLISVLGASACAYLSHRIVGSMRASLATEKSARAAERRARRSHDAAERERAALLEKSLASQKLESVGRLAGGVAHDFNNTLMVIRAGIDFLQQSAELEGEQREVLTEVLGAVDAAAGTSRQLLAFATPRPENVGTCTPREVLDRFRGSIRRLLPESIAVEVEGDGPSFDIGLSAAAFEQVLLNLVLNARDAMPQGGRIVLGCVRDRNDALVFVRDDGVGIPEDVRARIFEPFFTTKKDRGTGLGLPMVWGVVTHAGGTIEVDSKLGRGTTFALRFPALATKAPAPVAPPPTALSRLRRVLVLEDQPDVLRAIARMLRSGGYETHSFDRAKGAIDAIGTYDFDVLLTDVVVPGGGVAELIARFRKRYPGAPVLVCSGHVDEELVAAGIESGDYHFLRKPFAANELLTLLAGLTTGGVRLPLPAARA